MGSRWPRDVAGLVADLRAGVEGEVASLPEAVEAYATDASNFRQPPIAAVIPASIADVIAAHRICAAHGAPILPRGAGTSISGGAVNQAVVIDFTGHLGSVGPIDPDLRQVCVQPGAVNDLVNQRAAPYGLRFGPDPASHATCTIGGNIGCNACGMHSLQARFQGDGSRTSDNLAALDVLTYDGIRLNVGPSPAGEIDRIVAAGGRKGQIYRDLRELRDRCGQEIRRRFPRIPRRVSGYNLDDLLEERGFNVAAALAGTEGTCVTILGATLKLIPEPASVSLLVLGYRDALRVGDHLGEILAACPLACETFDRTLFGTGGATPPALTQLPEGNAWVLIELGAASRARAAAKAAGLAARLRRASSPPTAIGHLDDPVQRRRIWDIREAGIVASSKPTVTGSQHYPGWEDSAVAPEDVGAYLRDLRKLFDRFGFEGAFYGHLGDGCIHTRINFDFASSGGIAHYREFLEEAADLVVSYGGSLSGEHGDGHQRAELLPRMFGAELVKAFGEFKAIWDPDGRMNPGKIVDPYRLDQHLK